MGLQARRIFRGDREVGRSLSYDCVPYVSLKIITYASADDSASLYFTGLPSPGEFETITT